MLLKNKIRLGLWSIFFILISCLAYRAIAPGGKATYVYDFTKPIYFLSQLTPQERLQTIDNNSQTITGDPVYFNLRTLRKFNQAQVTLKYTIKTDYQQSPQCLIRNKNKNEAQCPAISTPIIEIGPLANKAVWRYNLQPLENFYLDDLTTKWSIVKNNNTILLQRPSVFHFSTLTEFLNNPPQAREIALYNYDLKNKYILPDYVASNEVKDLDFPLRGSYEFYTYIKKENLNFNLALQDSNQHLGSDTIDAFLYSGNKIMEQKHLNDDNNISDDTVAGPEQSILFNQSDLPEGVYKIEIRASSDIITKKITTTQTKLAFINKIQLANNSKTAIDFYTNSHKISALTTNPANLQAIQVGGSELKLDQTYKQYSLSTNGGVTKITLAKDDIILSGDGLFSFSTNSLITPGFKKVGLDFDPDQEGVNYILAEYSSPLKTGEWNTASANFDLTSVYREKGQYSFLISIPGLKADDEVDDGVIIKEIKVELTGDNWLDYLNKLKNWLINKL